MAFTYDPSTAAGKVRLLCTDVDEANAMFDDAEISAFLALESDDVRLAAATALETIASNELLVLKVQTILDVETDGAAVARELRMRAQNLREQANETGEFDYAELVVDGFTARQRVWNEALREG